MFLPRIEISPPSETKQRRSRTVRKTRTFHARLLGYLTADDLWEFGTTADGSLRPAFLSYFCTSGASKPFTANLQAGRPAQVEPLDRLQLPKSSSHRWVHHPVPGGIVTLAYLPELFHLQPALPFVDDPRFVVAPDRRWIERQAQLLEPEFGPDAPDIARAALFVAYLDRRTPLPLVRDLRFHLDLYRAARETPWLREPNDTPGLRAFGLDRCHLETPLVCAVDLATLSEFLAAHTAEFHRLHLRPTPQTSPTAVDLQAASTPLQLGLDLLPE